MARLLAACVFVLASASCGSSTTTPGGSPRSYPLGFSATPPRLEIASVLATIEAWRSHADIALVTQTVPWKSLLADTAAPFLVRRDLAQLIALYRPLCRTLPCGT